MPIPAPPSASGLYTLEFVDSIAASPTVRLNLNDGDSFRALREGCRFDPPPLNRAVETIILNDGAAPSASAFDNRTVDLQLLIKASSPDALAAQLRLLMVELNRESNILLYQPGTTPLFFRTFRSADPELDWSQQALNRLTVTVKLLAESTAYGLKQTFGPTTITNNPAAGANGLYMDITGVNGDVPTPLFLFSPDSTFKAQQTANGPNYISRESSPGAGIYYAQMESGTAATDTAVAAANDATMSGAGNNYMRTTFVTTTMLTRVSLVAANFVNAPPPGTYRILMRLRRSTVSDVFSIQIVRNGITNGPVTWAASATSLGVFDLGLIQLPGTADPKMPIGYGTVPTSSSVPALQVQAARTSGSGTLDYDYLMLLPADEELMTYSSDGTAGSPTVIDGPNDALYSSTNADPSLGAVGFVTFSRGGTLPDVTPGVTNRICLIVGVTASGATGAAVTNQLGGTAAVTAWAWPRYLIV